MAGKHTLTGLFGGTFDPIHNGHLLPLRQAAHQVGIDKVGLMPCHIPPHKGMPRVTSQQRLEMVKLASKSAPLFYADDFELSRNTPSYSVETLKQKKQQFPQQTLCFFMGMDSLKSLNSWYQWQDILTFCHIVVCQRPGKLKDFNPDISQLLARCQVSDPGALQQLDNGCIFLADTEELDISATQIRTMIQQKQSISHLVPAEVEKYIYMNGLYRNQSDKLLTTTDQ